MEVEVGWTIDLPLLSHPLSCQTGFGRLEALPHQRVHALNHKPR